MHQAISTKTENMFVFGVKKSISIVFMIKDYLEDIQVILCSKIQKHSVTDNFKRILVQCDDVKDYVIKVMRIKKQKSMGEMSPDDIINKDHKVSNAVNKHLMKQNTPSIILDYKKFFIEQNQSHIDEIAKFVGFMSDTTSNNLIKYYTERNKILYESDRLH
jgi:hypothetical protein